MNIVKTIEEKYLKKLKNSDFVGVEIEMPIINRKSPYKVEMSVIQGLFQELIKNGFDEDRYDIENNIICVRNKNNKDTVSLEYSLNTLEISLGCEKSIYELRKRFDNYLDIIHKYLENFQYEVVGKGINPNYLTIDKSCLNQGRYKAIEKILYRENEPLFSSFCSYCCSVQTHINLDREELVDIFNTFTLIEDNKAKMFSNSYMRELHLKNARKYLWEHSNFGIYNTGKNKIYKTVDDIIQDYTKRYLFFVQREGIYYVLEKGQPISHYFEKKKVLAYDIDGNSKWINPIPEDMDNFRSHKNIELTCYGTLEIRTDCTPKLEKVFTIVAFNIGVRRNYKKVLEHIKKYRGISNYKLMEYAIEGLNFRGYNEEKLLEDTL